MARRIRRAMAAPSSAIPRMVALVLAALALASFRAPVPARAQEDGVGSDGAQAERGVPSDVVEGHDETAEKIAEYRARAENSEHPRDRYNLGTAYLTAEQWPEARTELARAAEEAEGKVQRFSRYNLGVANAMEGHPDGEASDDERRQRLISARDAFREVLREDPEDPSTRWNLELVNRWLEEASAGGGGSSQDEDQDQGGAGGSAGQQGPAEPGGQAPSLTREEAEQLLRQAAGAEDDVRDKTLRRGRLRDPVVERNW
jgi:tetratricopeptide (TPR) repeat protein